MSQRTEIKSPNGGRIYGWVEHRDNGEVWAYQWPGKIVAMYNPITNKTTDFLHRPLSEGDTTAAWIKPC